MKLFMPERAFFEPSSLNYPLGQALYDRFQREGVEIIRGPSQSISRAIPGTDERQKYAQAKKTLVIAVQKRMNLDVCRPSADFEFKLVSNCPGSCEYCYLQTTQGYRPYLKVFVNLEDIFTAIRRHISGNSSSPTVFEAASTGDPLALEHLTGSVARTVEFFGDLDDARLRIVTKFSHVDPLLHLRHNERTRFRISINARYVIDSFEHNTASFQERLEAASKIAGAGYPMGFIVAPIMVYDGWKEEYRELFDRLRQQVGPNLSHEPLTFELIQHRFTEIAKKFILERFPNTKLDLDESKRMLKWGRFGRYKYVYPKELSTEMKEYISGLIRERFEEAVIEYFT